MTKIEECFKILNINAGADKNQIKKAYYRLAREHHPDKGGNEEKMKEINTAYAILINKEKIPVQQFRPVQHYRVVYYYGNSYQWSREMNNTGTAAF